MKFEVDEKVYKALTQDMIKNFPNWKKRIANMFMISKNSIPLPVEDKDIEI